MEEDEVTPERLIAMLEAQRYRCALTGRELTPSTTSLDHVKPLKLNGLHIMSNVQLVCQEAQKAKGSMTMEEFVALCAAVAERAAARTPAAEGPPIR